MPLIAILLTFIFLAADAPTPQFKVPDGGGIVYGDELGVGISAPKGWVFDSQSGVAQGMHAVMYPEGRSWAEASEVMYVNVSRAESGQTLASFISSDVARFKENTPKLAVETGDPIEIRGGTKAEVRLYTGDAWGNHEAVAYVAHGSSVAIYVLSCRNKEGFLKSRPAFRQMVANSFLVNMVLKK